MVPRLVGTSARYLDQIALSLRPATVVVAYRVLRIFYAYLVAHHGEVTTFAAVVRSHIEGYKAWLAARLTPLGTLPSANTLRQRLGMLHSFFDRISEWDGPDAPGRMPIFDADLPRGDEPLPRFLPDADAALLARAIATEATPGGA